MERAIILNMRHTDAPLSAVDPASQDDAALVATLAVGDTHALEILYQRHSRSVYSLAVHLLNDAGTAEEVVQETFLKLWRDPSTYQPTRGRLLPWLLGVAHHHSVDLLRRRKLEQRHRATPPSEGSHPSNGLENQVIASDQTDPQQTVSTQEQRRTLEDALARLPADQRVPLELAYYRGLTQAEIAQTLSQPLGTIKTRMRTALLKLRETPGLLDLWRER